MTWMMRISCITWITRIVKIRVATLYMEGDWDDCEWNDGGWGD